MIRIIQYNPYRLVGVFATATKREIISNIAQIKANLRVNRQLSFNSDLDSILSPCDRTTENISDAESKLTLPKDIIYYAQFWFIISTELDKIAINNLSIGDIGTAISIWEKKDNLSSIHNRVVTYLIKGELEKALDLAFLFYSRYTEEYTELILGKENQIVSSENLAIRFLDALCEEISASEISLYIRNKEWREYVSNKVVTKLIDSIERSITICKESKGKGSQARLEAGTKLMADTLNTFKELKDEIPSSNPKYQIIADKLGLEILQCGIDYYNDSYDDDAAHKAMKLQKYAFSIVVGKMAKDRCAENVHILEDIISQLPPMEVLSDDKAIQFALIAFESQPNLIKYSIQLLKDCTPHIVAIKEKLGKNNQYYLNISTVIIDKALGNVIAEVNEAQKKDFEALKNALISAWKTLLYMDKFDLDQTYKEGRYKESRTVLYNIIEKCKGFENHIYAYRYKYGCGWCNNLDVSDIDLRTDFEYFTSCTTLASYKAYVQRFPRGKYLKNAQAKIIEFSYKGCKTIADFQMFINDYPNSIYQERASIAIEILQREEEERKVRETRQEKAISACTSLNDILSLYAKEKAESINEDKCSSKAYELAKCEEDYKKILSTFQTRSVGYKNAKNKIEEIKKIRSEKVRKRKKIFKWFLGITIPLSAILGIYLYWGIGGLVAACYTIAAISAFIAIGVMKSNDSDGCVTVIIAAIIAAVFGMSGKALYELEEESNLKKEYNDLYEQIINSPAEADCSKYIRKYDIRDAEKTNRVRRIWLNLLKNEARRFDYNSYKPTPANYAYLNPLQRINEFIDQNNDTNYRQEARAYINLICDSLYNIANSNSTILGWKQYQRVVPTEYFRDSEEKIEEINNKAWNTEAKAWKQATTENSISAYEKYKALYPKGAHISICEKRLIDLEVSRIYAGDHGTLPAMDKTSYGGGTTSYITVSNSTSYTLTILYSGPDSKRLIINAGGTKSVRLKNGQYRVAASVSAANVSNYAGSENLNGGSYSVDYYISTYRY